MQVMVFYTVITTVSSALEHTFSLDDPETVRHESQIRKTSITRRVQTGDMVIRIRGGKVDRHSHQVTGHGSTCVVVGVYGDIQKVIIGGVDV